MTLIKFKFRRMAEQRVILSMKLYSVGGGRHPLGTLLKKRIHNAPPKASFYNELCTYYLLFI